ncbi:MAG: DUF1501 domain-containing protein, partial [Chloroflexi bacterium]|nr:DUF1501 domain-containing protein [Chloroflexota bacterium]
GLNMIVPYGDADYFTARPELAIPETEVLDLDGFFGLHPALGPLHPLFQGGQMTAVHAVGNPHPTRSHFDAMSLMEGGAQQMLDSGWLGRHLMTLNYGNESPLRAIGWGHALPHSLHGPVSAIALQSIVDYHLDGRPETAQAMMRALNALYALDGNGLADAAAATQDAINVVGSVDIDAYPVQNGAVYPEDEFGLALQQTAVLIRAEVGLEVSCIDLGGWDTHDAQGGVEGLHATLMDTLAAGLAALHTDLGDLMERVTVVVMSEFGRRVQENASRGTDHGHGNMMFVMGGAVSEVPVIAQWPTLAAESLDRGDLAITTDYRSVLGEVLANRLGNPALAEIFPDFTPSEVGVVRA